MPLKQPATFVCKSEKHHWLNQSDADKCCNGYKRCLLVVNGHWSHYWEAIEALEGRG